MRFPEFTDEWNSLSLNDVSNDCSYGVSASATEFDREYKYIRITDIDDDTHKFTPSPLVSPKGDIDSKYILHEGDLVFARTGATVGKSYLYEPSDGTLVYAGYLIRFHIDRAVPKFIFYLTNRSYYWNWVSIMSVRSGQPGINMEEYKKLPIIIPSNHEQEKITSFLSKIDKKIDLLRDKKDEYIEFKRYLLQNLFPQNGETAPKLRFNQFTTNNWKTVTLVECVTCLDSERKPLNEEKRRKNRGVFPYYGANGLVDHINQYIFNDTLVLLAEDGGFFNEYTEKPIAQLVNGKIWVNNHAHVLKNKNNLNITFLYYSLVHKDIRKYINGTSRSKLNQKDMFSIVINITSIEEQKKIASFLSFVDKKIDLLDQEIEQVEEYKKGLLQKMFIWRVVLCLNVVSYSDFLKLLFVINYIKITN